MAQNQAQKEASINQIIDGSSPTTARRKTNAFIKVRRSSVGGLPSGELAPDRQPSSQTFYVKASYAILETIAPFADLTLFTITPIPSSICLALNPSNKRRTLCHAETIYKR